MHFFKTISVEEALDKISNNKVIKETLELLSLENSLNRVLGEDIYSPIDLPSFNRSLVDGYAVLAEDTFGASESFPSLLNLKGEIKMGEYNATSISHGETLYVPTGAMIPNNSNAVAMIEDCDKLGNEILNYKSLGINNNIISKGQEIEKNKILLKKNTLITPYHIAVLASVGISKIKVFSKLQVSIISTGDEIIPIDKELPLGGIYDINTYLLKSYVESLGGNIVKTQLVKDNEELLNSALKESIKKSDLVLISGGSSVGVRDFTKKSIENLNGEILAHGLSVKPGKPAILAKCNDCFIIGLPGHPQSAINVFRIFQNSFFNIKQHFTYGILEENLSGDTGKKTYINVSLHEINEEIYIKPILSKSSMVRPLIDSDGYIIIPEYKEGFYKGERIKVYFNV
ncbi:molybdopterin molybdotransferase MoeA [Cetobacterium sp. SF1]|uniref:molybdopterin molybdotransferase MoeA n=1 Tax=unclassified Cetobacterium TaxID=2630983 RepID=UPI003CF62E8B